MTDPTHPPADATHASAPGITTQRIEAFSDGVFAIVITLLVLELRVPQLPAGHTETQLLQELGALWPKVLSFVLSFAIVGVFWVGHHMMFHYIQRADRNLLWLNNLFLLCVSFIPFPTALMGDYIRDPIAVVPYGLSILVTSLAVLLIWHYAVSGRRLVAAELDARLIRAVYRRVARAPVLYLAAILLSLISARLTLWAYVAILATYILPSRIDHVHARVRGPGEPAAGARG